MSRDRSNTISRERERLALPADPIAARREVAPTFGDGFPRVAEGEGRSPQPSPSVSVDDLEPTPLFPVERSLSETTPPIDPAELQKFRAVPADAVRGRGAYSNTAVSHPVPARTEPRQRPRAAASSGADTKLTGVAAPDRNGQSGFAVTQLTPQDPRDVREGAAARAEQRLADQHPEVARLADALRADQVALADAYAETQITDPTRRGSEPRRPVESSTERWLSAIDEPAEPGPPISGVLARATPANPWRTAPPTPAPRDADTETRRLLDPNAVTRASGSENTVVPPAPQSRTGDDVLEVALEDLCARSGSGAHPPALPSAARAVAPPSPSQAPPSLDPAPTPSRRITVAPTRAEQREVAQRLILNDETEPAIAPESSATPAGELDAASALQQIAAIPPLAWVGAISFVVILVWLFTM